MRLVLAVHGTASTAGQQVYRDLAAQTSEHVPTALAHLDVQQPLLGDVARAGDVVVPVLLARGYHVRVDCAAAAPAGAVVTGAVGPDPALVRLADRRLRQAGVGDHWSVVLAAAGSRDATARHDLQLAARRLGRLRGSDVGLAFASRPGEVAAAVVALRERTERPVGVATWLLAPGRFAEAVAGCGAEAVAAPLGADVDLVRVVLQRWRAARQALAA